ncbi:MAG: TIGR04283 family arsenosugar biosynthesis glycosyltransferase [Sideroxyarcus sp.]|nr:TIGR04283 family arsenosugar biosynthesis glycosyltransferase [Sideroxyarcus sp.]
MKLSIIIPMLNEAAQLPDLFAHLLPLCRAGCEVIFVDGGSSDGSPKLATAAGFTVVQAARGRARQMNAGAARAGGEVLLFLHADTRLPSAAPHLIAQALAGADHCWGRFDVYISGRPFMLRVIAQMMNWRSGLSGIATGDQAIFVRRSVFEQLRGFPEQPLMEDVELSKRLKVFSRPACIKQCVFTSGRRWETRGIWRSIFLMWRLRWAYWRGVDAHELAGWYQ